MNNEQVVSRFERFVFAISRFLIGLTAMSAVIGIVGCALFLFGKFDKPTAVTYVDVTQALSETSDSRSNDSSSQSAAITPAYVLPSNLKPYLSGENQAVLDGWMRNIDDERQRAEFLSELSSSVKSAVAGGRNVNDIINTYKELKFKKISQSAAEKYEAIAAKAGIAAALFGLIFLLVILALALVIMAIERHGRRINEALSLMQAVASKTEANTRATALTLRPRPASASPAGSQI